MKAQRKLLSSSQCNVTYILYVTINDDFSTFLLHNIFRRKIEEKKRKKLPDVLVIRVK